MGRKNSNATKSRRQSRKYKVTFPKGFHLMYSPHEFGEDATVVRYMGEQDGDYLTVFHPEGFVFEAHMHNLWIPQKKAA